jgi:hypothetical protein
MPGKGHVNGRDSGTGSPGQKSLPQHHLHDTPGLRTIVRPIAGYGGPKIDTDKGMT